MKYNPQNQKSPYRGLQPYTEADFDTFFGRDEQAEVVVSNLYVAPLTIVYGASGVGKSSLLAAGVVHKIRKSGIDAVILFRNWQSSKFAEEIKKQIIAETARVNSRALDITPHQPLDELLAECCKYIRGQLLIVFDQFEEYFLYHVQTDVTQPFEVELARSINRRDLNVNVLLALREDDLSKLDRFQGRIPNILSNMLRIEHLDEAAAVDAIRKPLQYYNDHLPTGDTPISIEEELITTIISQVETGQVTFSERSSELKREEEASSVLARSIEAPYLQLVLTRLWDEEMARGSRKLRLATLLKLGSAQKIVCNHLDSVLRSLRPSERAVAARVFQYLVTGSRKKYAHAASSLASWANLPKHRVEKLLKRLAAPEIRLLRTIRAPGDEERFEIFHDVLAPGVMEYAGKYRDQRRLHVIVGLVLALAVAMCLSVSAEYGLYQARASRSVALLVMGQSALDAQEPLSAEMILASSLALKDSPETREKILEARSYGVSILPSIRLNIPNGKVFSWGEQIEAAGYDHDHIYVESNFTGRVASLPSPLPRNMDSVSFAVSKDCQRIAEAGHDGSVWVVDHNVNRKIIAFDPDQGPATCIAFSPDGHDLAIAGPDYQIRIFNTRTGREVQVFSGHTDSVNAMSFSPDGRLLASGGSDYTVKVWNLSGHGKQAAEFDEHVDEVTCVAFSPDGELIASGGNDRAIYFRSLKGIFDPPPIERSRAQKGHKPWIFTAPAIKLVGHQSLVSSLAFSPDGRLLLSASKDRTARLWDIQNTHATVVQVRAGASGLISVAWSKGGDMFASTAEDGSLHTWRISVADGLVRTFRGHRHPVSSVVFCGDGDRLATASTDRSNCSIKIWNINRQDRPPMDIKDQPDQIVWLAASRSNGLLASGGMHGYVRLFNSTTGMLIGTLSRHRGPVWGLAFDNSGSRLASGDEGGLVQIWRTSNRQRIVPLQGEKSKVNCIAWSPDNRWLAAGHQNGVISLWDMSVNPPRPYKLGASGDSIGIWDLAFNPSSSSMASASEDETVRQWNMVAEGFPSQPLNGHQGEVWTVAFSPDGKQIASGSDDGTIRLWNAATNMPEMVLRSPQQTIWSVAYSPDGKFLASGGLDWTARLWDLSGARHIRLASSSELLAEASSHTGLSLEDFNLRPASNTGIVGNTKQKDTNEN